MTCRTRACTGSEAEDGVGGHQELFQVALLVQKIFVELHLQFLVISY